MIDAFMFYKSMGDVCLKLNSEDKAIVFEAIINFCFYDKEPTLTGVPEIVFAAIRVHLVMSVEHSKRYKAKVEAGKANGHKGAVYGHLGGRPKKNKEVEFKGKVIVNKNVEALDFNLINEFSNTEQEAIKEFIQYRNERNSKMTKIAFKNFIILCSKFKSKSINIIDCINLSITSNWMTIYEPKINTIYNKVDSKDKLKRCNSQDYGGTGVSDGVWE